MSHIALHQKQFNQREAAQRVAAQRLLENQRQILEAYRHIEQLRKRVAVLEKSRKELVSAMRQGFAAIDEVLIAD